MHIYLGMGRVTAVFVTKSPWSILQVRSMRSGVYLQSVCKVARTRYSDCNSRSGSNSDKFDLIEASVDESLDLGVAENDLGGQQGQYLVEGLMDRKYLSARLGRHGRRTRRAAADSFRQCSTTLSVIL